MLEPPIKDSIKLYNLTIPKIIFLTIDILFVHFLLRFSLERNDIGNCHKRKYWKTYTDKFSVTIKFFDSEE